MGEILQFQNYSSAPDLSFWHALCDYKLNVARLKEKEACIWGYYVPGEVSKEETKQISNSKSPTKRAYVYFNEDSLKSQFLTS